MKNKNELSEDLGNLRRVGFELESPQDEFSYQPDSGSTTGGRIGKDEYGITDSNDDDDDAPEDSFSVVGGDEEADPLVNPQAIDKDSSGVSEYSLSHTDPDDVKTHQAPQKSLEKLQKLLDIRLKHIPILEKQSVAVSLNGAGLLMTGELQTEAQKMQAEEVAEAVCGNVDVESRLTVTQH